ncbi:DUF1800 domain-containing protein [Minwuia thermotolerans]|uniref:DUF1800 domain-containing protein n=1 Tax=Minwuia thermotolerans TaxID=2056226 RepID=A0A2M9FX44_9PROT|nr:DUF1800 domain-containing protein [Minwuia thermotolerans]PJK28027.1 DUF1800 domain-containing protein [Minwuia thermotolerans]
MTMPMGAVAAIRFGYGPRPGEIERRAGDPQGSLLAELAPDSATPEPLTGLPQSAAMLSRFMRARRSGGNPGVIRLFKNDFRMLFLQEAMLRTRAAVLTDTPFRERLVHFWSNHFTVSARKAVLLGLAGGFEREAIRPHIMGRFEDLLVAAVRHPGMIFYLDNVLSIGPRSEAGRRLGKGMNENLAREILELHTLGADGGYSQADVEALALMLTGWSVGRPDRERQPGAFWFYARAHQPGAKTLLGRRYADDGAGQAEAALRDLARHPATARHVCARLLRHFVADRPDPADLDYLVRVWSESGGDLPTVYRGLIGLRSAWTPLTKLKTPNDLLISSLRATGIRKVNKWVVSALELFGQAPWSAPTPKGWPDRADAWLSADQAMRRIEYAGALGERMTGWLKPERTAGDALGPLLPRDMAVSVALAESEAQALAILFAAPAFQRR